jgi:hypothetical protein
MIETHGVELRHLATAADLAPWLPESIGQGSIACARVAECDRCCCEDDRIVESESTPADPKSCKGDAQRVAKAEADCEAERISVADVLAECARVRHGVMCCSRLAEISARLDDPRKEKVITIDCR